MIMSLTTARIVPDSNNPVQMNEATNTNNGASIYLKFSLSTPLHYKQFIGVTFPSIYATDLGFDSSSKFTCALSQISASGASTVVLVKDSTSVAAENYIAY
jgi:hypothetical protein